jgi:hypothetical protein
MKAQATRTGFTLRLDSGEEIVWTLTAFAAARGVRSGTISGLGSAAEIELGYFDRGAGEYLRRRLEGEFEILSLTGNLSELEGTPFAHLHAVVGGRDFAALGGHLFHAVVTVTCELQLVTDPGVMRRVRLPGTAFRPIEPAE